MMDSTPVTNAQFRAFVEATGYVTFAEITPDAKDYPGALPHMLKAGSLVFGRRRGRSISITGRNGGNSVSALHGAARMDAELGSMVSTITPLFMSPIRMPKPTHIGRAKTESIDKRSLSNATFTEGTSHACRARDV